MNRRSVLSILLLMSPLISCADIWDNSASRFYIFFYVFSVVPALLWIFNVIVFFLTRKQKRIHSGIFWTVIPLNLLFAVLSLAVSVNDVLDYKRHNLMELLVTGILLGIIPLLISIKSIAFRRKSM